jgi:anion-transporting  ArsA/GET3 family ATPase
VGSSLLDKRLLIVTGKGGVGKSVVAAALAHLASRRGKNVLLVEMDTEDRLGDLFECAPVGDRVVPLRENVSGIDLIPRTVLAEFFRTHVKFKAVYGPILDSRIFNYFLDAAPALRELVCLGKLYKLVHDHSWWSSKPVWDMVVFDAPATGHGLGLLDVPESASHILLGGMRTNALKIRDMLRDPALTALNIVTLPEEMPLNEAVLLHEQARAKLGIPVGAVFLNSVFPDRSTDATLDPGSLARAAQAALGSADAGPALARAVAFERERAQLSAHYRRELRARVDAPVVELPYFFTERFGFAEVDRLAAHVARGLGITAAAVPA